MNTIILVGCPDRTLLGVAAMFQRTRRGLRTWTCAAVEIPPSSSLGNPGGSSSLIELAISRTIRFVSYFEPVAAVASTQASSVGVTIRYCTSATASASNCIHALRRNNNIVTMPTRDVLLRHFCKMSLTVGIRGCTLLSLMYSCYSKYVSLHQWINHHT